MSYTPCTRLRFYVGESDQVDGEPVYERIVREARAHAMSGATVLRGMMGFGVHSEIRTAKILRLSENLPVIVEVIDKPEKIDAFLGSVENLISQGMVTREPIEVRAFRNGS